MRDLMLPWWLSGKDQPANAGDMGSIPGPGRFHMLQSNEAGVPQLLSPRAATTDARVPWSACFATREATTTRKLCPAARE